MSLDLSKINQLDFPANQYIREKFPKDQIYLHHTASGKGVDGDFHHWLNTTSRIATAIIIDHKGVLHQCFSSGFWGYHLGIPAATFNANGLTYKRLDKTSIGIEIDAWGSLAKKNGKYYSYTGKVIEKSRVTEYPEGFKTIPKSPFFDDIGVTGNVAQYYESYTDAQLRSTEELLEFWHERYGIPLHYNKDMWDISRDALRGKRGVYTHVSVRKDKSDCHPQPELIQMLKRVGGC